MLEPTPARPEDVHGVGRIAIAATLGITDLVEAVHSTILQLPPLVGPPVNRPTGGIAGLVYGSIRAITTLVGGGIDLALAPFTAALAEQPSSPARDAALAALNGVVGDYLQATANPLASTMELQAAGQRLELSGPALRTALPQASGKILLLAHGLCLNERHWDQAGHNHGARLAAELGYTPIYLRYNTGLHISANGRQLAGLLEALSAAWPVPIEELTILTHSMGGLVARSACGYAERGGYRWARQLRAIIFLGTPHHGSPLERTGSWVDGLLQSSPYTAAFARLGQIRSAGITDLRYGNLCQEDWAGSERFSRDGDRRRPLPLPAGVDCLLIAATTGGSPGDLQDQLIGDGLVPLASALGQHPDSDLALPASLARCVVTNTSHMDLLGRSEVYARIRSWLAERGTITTTKDPISPHSNAPSLSPRAEPQA